MQKFKAVCLYQFRYLLVLAISFASVLLFNFILGTIMKAVAISGGSIDIVTFVFALLVGFMVLRPTFNFSIYNGASRKTVFFASIITIFITAFAWALFTMIIIAIADAVASPIVIYNILYSKNYFACFLWLFSVIFALIAISWFVAVLLQRLSKVQKFILIGILILIPPIVILFDNMVDGKVIVGIIKTIKLFLGNLSGQYNPYISVGMMLIVPIVILPLCWLIIRKIEIK